MHPGQLDRRVTIQQVTDGRDEYQGPTKSWSTFATVYARVVPLEGHELFAARRVNAKMSHRVELWYLAGVTPKMRVLDGSQELEIESVIRPPERREELHLLCTEWVDG